MFPDLESELLDLLAMLVTSTNVGTVAPADLATRLPFIRVNRYGGPDDGVTDFAAVDIDVFAATRMVAWDLSERCRRLVTTTPRAAGSHIDFARVRSGPQRLPWDNPDITRFGLSVEVTARRVHHTI